MHPTIYACCLKVIYWEFLMESTIDSSYSISPERRAVRGRACYTPILSFQEHCVGAIPRRRHCRRTSGRAAANHHHIRFMADADFPGRFLNRLIVF
jgi:hypothetical protein